MKRKYVVEGRWPFPQDMLRHDQAQAASPADQTLIDRMSGEASDPEFGTRKTVSVHLVMESGEATRGRPQGRLLPNDARWNSFGWTVRGVPEIEENRLYDEALRARDIARQSGLAKLTAEERQALGLCSQST